MKLVATLGKIQSARISPSNFDGKLPNILFACLCIRVLRVVVVVYYEVQRGRGGSTS